VSPHRRAFLGLGLLVAALGIAAARTQEGAPRHLVLVSLDGLRPEFYLDDGYAAPELRALLGAGSHARAAEAVFPTVTYPNHASMVTGVRPARHGISFNVLFDPAEERGRWYEEAADLRAPPLWNWARAAGRRTAAVSWPSTLGAPIDALLPERDYYVRADAMEALRAAVTPGLLERLGVAPPAEVFRSPIEWDAFLAATAAAIIREDRPHLLLLHLVQLDYFQHRGGREGAEVGPALLRADAHLGALRRALAQVGLADRTAIIVSGDHGFQDVQRVVFPNQILADAGLRGCPRPGIGWRATAHLSGGAAAVFVAPPDRAAAALLAETALRGAGAERLRVVSRRELDELGAMPEAAFAIEAGPGFELVGSCSPAAPRLETAARPGSRGMHGYLPSRPGMATGFVAAGAGVRAGVALERIRLVDIAPTAARLLGVPAPPVEGRVLEEILR
jgi:predicted AlkP superfamily pyrophosphatase or phosphodiesterase